MSILAPGEVLLYSDGGGPRRASFPMPPQIPDLEESLVVSLPVERSADVGLYPLETVGVLLGQPGLVHPAAVELRDHRGAIAGFHLRPLPVAGRLGRGADPHAGYPVVDVGELHGLHLFRGMAVPCVVVALESHESSIYNIPQSEEKSMAKAKTTAEEKREKARIYAKKWRAAKKAEKDEREMAKESWELIEKDAGATSPEGVKVTSERKVITGPTASFSMTPGTSVELINELEDLRSIIRGPRV